MTGVGAAGASVCRPPPPLPEVAFMVEKGGP